MDSARRTSSPEAIGPGESREAQPTVAEIREQLDSYAEARGLKSLRDRIRIGLNEVGAFAYRGTDGRIRELCGKLAGSEDGSEELYRGVEEVALRVQQSGPWAYAGDFRKSAAEADPAVKAWLMVNRAVNKGHEREMDLNESEFFMHLERLQDNLDDAVRDPDAFAAEVFRRFSEREFGGNIRFDGKRDPLREAPISEGLNGFVDMAASGYAAGVAQDAQGWVYVGSKDKIDDRLVASCGLIAETGPDDRDPKRTVTWFSNEKGERVVKKLHGGFLIVTSKNLGLGVDIAKAINRRSEVVEAAESSVEHIVYEPTSRLEDDDEPPDWIFKRPRGGDVKSSVAETGEELLDLEREFYDTMKQAKGRVTYIDTLRKIRADRRKKMDDLRKKGQEIGPEEEEKRLEISGEEKGVIIEKLDRRLDQKMDELRHMMSFIGPELERRPDIKSVIDMAGGAGDLGLAVASDMLMRGRGLRKVDIVDPYYGDFMKIIIDHLPFKDELEKKARHTGSALQEAEITPDSIVVAKHACGTLADDIFERWVDSDSPVLVAMTCCQDKAKDQPARYGFYQREWHDLCVESAKTNTQVPEDPGPVRDRKIADLRAGNEAMHKLDMARVEYLRRMGFKADLHKTDKFPKGDVIVARRLPRDLMAKLSELQRLEKRDPVAFDDYLARLDDMSRGGDGGGLRGSGFGKDWIDDDFAELAARASDPFYRELPRRERPAVKEVKEAGEAGKQGSLEAGKAGKNPYKAFLEGTFGKAGLHGLLRAKYEAAGKSAPPGGKIGEINRAVSDLWKADPAVTKEDVLKAIDEAIKEDLS